MLRWGGFTILYLLVAMVLYMAGWFNGRVGNTLWAGLGMGAVWAAFTVALLGYLYWRLRRYEKEQWKKHARLQVEVQTDDDAS